VDACHECSVLEVESKGKSNLLSINKLSFNYQERRFPYRVIALVYSFW
jgi:hypothetical protein